jgi:hypothetical protein
VWKIKHNIFPKKSVNKKKAKTKKILQENEDKKINGDK